MREGKIGRKKKAKGRADEGEWKERSATPRFERQKHKRKVNFLTDPWSQGTGRKRE